jgi:hypothetical protein
MKDKSHLFKKGQSGNPAGKKKGTVHNKRIRQMISEFLNEKFPEIEEDFKKLSPKTRVKFYIDLLQYGAPKLGAVSVSHEFKTMLTQTSDDELIQLMEGMILKREVLNEKAKTIELSDDQYTINEESQP